MVKIQLRYFYYKMIRYVLFIILCFFSFSSICQNWIKVYGNGLNANAYYIIETYDHGYLTAAQIQYGKYTWIFKTDINGNILWDKKIGTGMEQSFLSPMNIEHTQDNGLIIGGSTGKYGSYDAFIIKLNQCAEIEWCKVLITPTNFDEGFRVKQTPEGDYLLLGGYFNTSPTSNVSLFKFNIAGDLIWQQFYPMDSLYYDDQPVDLLFDHDGYLITASRYYPNPGTTGPAVIRSYFIKTDTAGNKIWDLVYGANDYYYSWPWATIKSQSSHYYNTCTHTNNSDNPAIIKILNNGTQSYNHDILNTGNFNFSGLSTIDILNDTNIVMAGVWNINNNQNNVIVKTDTLGNLRKTKQLPLITNTYISTAKTFDNKFVAVGNDATGGSWKIYAVKVNSDLEYDSIYTKPFTYDSLCPHPIVSDTVDPDCDNVYVGIEEPFKNPETTRLKVYPNPAGGHITIEMPKYLVVTNTSSNIPSTTVYHQWKSTLLEVYDLSGKKVFEKEIPRNETELGLDVSNWRKGMYVFRLLYNSKEVGNQKVLVE